MVLAGDIADVGASGTSSYQNYATNLSHALAKLLNVSASRVCVANITSASILAAVGLAEADASQEAAQEPSTDDASDYLLDLVREGPVTAAPHTILSVNAILRVQEVPPQ
eukprot:5734710-Pleurochrysis_carterae.AAC.1